MTQVILPSRKRLEKKNYYKATVNIKDFLKFYRNKYGSPTKGGCDPKITRAVLNEFNAYLADRILAGEKIVLPFNLGCLEISKKKQKYVIGDDGKIRTKGLMIDWNSTWEYWKKNEKAAKEKKLLYHTNEHTDSYRYRITWDKYGINNSKIRLYCFRPSRILSRRLKDYLMDENTPKNFAERC